MAKHLNPTCFSFWRPTTQLNDNKMPTADQNISSKHVLILFEKSILREQCSVGSSHARGNVHTLQSIFIQSKPLLEVVIRNWSARNWGCTGLNLKKLEESITPTLRNCSVTNSRNWILVVPYPFQISLTSPWARPWGGTKNKALKDKGERNLMGANW